MECLEYIAAFLRASLGAFEYNCEEYRNCGDYRQRNRCDNDDLLDECEDCDIAIEDAEEEAVVAE